ncbi:TetR/AcrR family transcriptional regulator [Actinomycetospora aeridis]|uniref:TetR/AcrR family transcriptional regulator C-terminal domain-containing protein n=1 Tax=Actinomycetospora aeridis TaxID=3129231 RepID=A0ABU8MYV7_9PSEU
MAPDRWAAQIAALDEGPRRAPRKPPITVERIVDTAFGLVEAEGYDALTMRRVATTLGTGPASLYAHVRDKAELDDLLIGALCARVTPQAPDPARWREQVVDVCRQLRDQYFRYPGISRAALATAPESLDAVRLTEGMLAILLAGGVAPQRAAWAIDAALLYVGAYSLEASLRQHAGGTDRRRLGHDEIVERFRMLPADRFPHVVAHAPELAAGDGHERFDFTLELLLGGLTP